MQITDVKISLRDSDERLKAFATVTLDDCFVVRGLKIIDRSGGRRQEAERPASARLESNGHDLFVAMPARQKPDGSYQDIAHPIDPTTRRMFEQEVLAAYFKERG